MDKRHIVRAERSRPRRTHGGEGRFRFELGRPALEGRVTLWLKVLALVILSWLVLEKVAVYLTHIGYAAIVAVGGLFLAYLVYPAIRWLNARLTLWASITIMYVAFGVALALLVWYLVPIVTLDLQNFVASLPKLESSARQILNDPHLPLLPLLPPAFQQYVQQLPTQIGTYIQRDATLLLSNMLGMLVSVLAVALLFVAIPAASIYMLTEAEAIKRFFLGMLPKRHRGKAKDVLTQLDEVVGGFIRGQLLVALTVGIMTSTMLLALRVPYAILIGVWAGIVDVVPYLGAFAGAIPAIFIALVVNGWQNAALASLGFVAINQLEGHLIVPRIVSKTVRVSPLVVIFSILIGGELFGMAGMLIAVPIAGAIRVLIENVRPPEELTTAEVGPGLTKEPQATDEADVVEP